MAADLDLEVLAPQMGHAPVGAHHAEVARAIHALGRIRCGGGEDGPGEVGPPPVAGREVPAPGRDLADLVGTDLPAVVPEHEDLLALRRVAHGHVRAGEARGLVDEEMREMPGLVRAVRVHEDASVREARLVGLDVPACHRLADQLDQAKVREPLVAREPVDEMPKGRDDDIEDGDPLVLQPCGDGGGALLRDLHRVHRGAVEDRAENVPPRRCEEGQTILGTDAVRVGLQHDLVQQVPVALGDSLRRPGGAGREEDQGEGVVWHRHAGVGDFGVGLQRVDVEHRAGAGGGAGGGEVLARREHESRVRLLQHDGESRRGEVRSQRHADVAGLQDPDHRDDERDAFGQQQCDGVLRPGGTGENGARDPIRGSIELGIRQPLPRRLDGDPVRVSPDLPREAGDDPGLELVRAEGDERAAGVDTARLYRRLALSGLLAGGHALADPPRRSPAGARRPRARRT